jgi:cysteine dioxygenase
VIDGVATETRFEMTASGLICAAGTRRLQPGHVCAAEEDDIHQVLNAEPEGRDLITLHIYSPPLTQYNWYRLNTPDAAGQTNVKQCTDVLAAD